ncbi:MAG: phosphate ABC transporter substrate-binding protein PstS [Kineosporiaceae bacterium]
MAAVVGLLAAAPARAATYVPISGAGSTWSANAVSQWAANVRQSGMTVNFQANGSSEGRKLFRQGVTDFGVTEIPYGLSDSRGGSDPAPTTGFAYMPVVAGGTSFMYNLKIGTKRVDNLRLSGATIAKIFTGQIRTWSDPAVKADNPGLTLPARKIIPVVRSDGSGTSAQFTLWMSKQHPAIWDAYCRKAGRATPCGLTSYYPVVRGLGFTAQNGSVQVAGYVASPTAEGAITYVEYSYAVNQRFPVAKVLNRSGYFVSPTPEAVAVALTGARINTDKTSKNYLTQILDGVYDNRDRRAYPLSSYSYMILPTAVQGRFTNAKGVTLGDFSYYFLCEGQQLAPRLGYSPLPINLVRAGLDQVKRIPGADVKNKDISRCNNPTFSKSGENTLAKTAPQPRACDRKGPTQCTAAGVAVTGGTRGGTGAGGSGSGGAGTGTATTGGGTTGAGQGGGTGTGGSGSGATVDPDTGQLVTNGQASAGEGTGNGDVSALPVSLAADYASGSSRTTLMGIAAALLLGVTVGPPLIARRLGRSRG